jgi:hypothetical protein
MRPPTSPSRYSFVQIGMSCFRKLRIVTGVLVAELSLTSAFYQRGALAGNVRRITRKS